VDGLVLDDQLRVGAELAVPPDAERRGFDLAANLLVVQGEVAVVKVQRVEGGVALGLDARGGLLAVDEDRQPAEDERLDLEQVILVDPDWEGLAVFNPRKK
jgi:hypothetical protein